MSVFRKKSLIQYKSNILTKKYNIKYFQKLKFLNLFCSFKLTYFSYSPIQVNIYKLTQLILLQINSVLEYDKVKLANLNTQTNLKHKFTVIRSPHIFKYSREHFGLRFFKKNFLIFISFKNYNSLQFKLYEKLLFQYLIQLQNMHIVITKVLNVI
jgi:hypothetical protein